jgi:conserved oligomeric Golgi complex subunit 8
LSDIYCNFIFSAHQHLTKTIEVTRVNLFNIVTQYKALFDDDFSKDNNTNSKMNLIFNSWLHEKIDDFLRMLENDLNQCNSSLMDISSILGQCMYFGVSFSRIGVDFRAQIAPIFLKAITKYLNMSVIKATKQFELDMENFTLINKDVSSYKRHTNEETEENENTPPDSLLDFNPLAVYCNAVLNLFNELRVCSPIAIVQPFVLALEVSLENVAKAILSFYRSEQQAFGMKEKENFLKMCTCFSFELLPYIQHCISLIFPTNNKLVHSIESITTLRIQKILEPIEHLLPNHKPKN